MVAGEISANLAKGVHLISCRKHVDGISSRLNRSQQLRVEPVGNYLRCQCYIAVSRWRSRRNPAARPEYPKKFAHNRVRILYVLKNIVRNNDIERAIFERQRSISLEDNLSVRTLVLQHRGIDVRSYDFAGAQSQILELSNRSGFLFVSPSSASRPIVQYARPVELVIECLHGKVELKRVADVREIVYFALGIKVTHKFECAATFAV